MTIGAVSRSTAAGLVYFAIVFSIGFLLGALRTLFVAPNLGELPAVLAELPIMLAISWVVCGWVLRKIAVSNETLDRVVVGSIALGLLMLAEAVVSVTIFGRSFAEHLSGYRQTSNLVGLIGQLLYAGFPLARRRTTENCCHPCQCPQ